jgi:hypothetical protein
MRSPARLIFASSALLALAAFAGCASSSTNANTSNSSANQSTQTAKTQTVVVPPVSSAHGTTAATPAQASGASVSEKPSVATPELDAKIAKADAKAKATSATDADKKAAAAAYIERANIYYSAQQPQLYKFALGDFRRALRYDPNNSEARGKMDQIVSIYQSMGRPVPTNGLDQQ